MFTELYRPKQLGSSRMRTITVDMNYSPQLNPPAQYIGKLQLTGVVKKRGERVEDYNLS